MTPDLLSLYDRAGGTPFFEALVGRFYVGVEADPLLRPLYPEPDLAGARHRLTLFLIQYWGGPTTYDEERGHPRLRMRHAPFAIGPAERDRWLVQCVGQSRSWPPRTTSPRSSDATSRRPPRRCATGANDPSDAAGREMTSRTAHR